MEPTLNPYSPGSGRKPPELVGRVPELEAFDTLVARTGNRLGDRGIVLTGLRGVGKTVLLNEMRNHADRHSWLTVQIEARRDETGSDAVRRNLARSLVAAARRFTQPQFRERMQRALQTITAFNASISATGVQLGVSLEQGRGDTGDPELDLLDLAEDVSTNLPPGKAFAIFIDEMQDLDAATLGALIAAQHAANQRDWPFYIIGAGLPNLPRILTETRSYAERLFNYRTIGQLQPHDAGDALREPAEKLGATYEPAALDRLVTASGGYPYFLQEYGYATWNLAPNKTITTDDATTAINYALESLDAGFFKSRWDRATKSERRFLIAMATDNGEPSSTSTIAERLELKHQSLGPYRANLIAKGLIYAPEHGYVSYTVPGMADYVHRHRENTD